MNDYMSVKETALAWGISERRVHKLCEDGRIENVSRLGRAWVIPAQTPKPPNKRGKRPMSATSNNTECRAFCAMLGPDAALSVQHKNCSVWQLENATGAGVVTMYSVFPGVIMRYNDLHLQKINDHAAVETREGAEALVINHCRTGRLECEFRNGECG
jgi:hypothetical protein